MLERKIFNMLKYLNKYKVIVKMYRVSLSNLAEEDLHNFLKKKFNQEDL